MGTSTGGADLSGDAPDASPPQDGFEDAVESSETDVQPAGDTDADAGAEGDAASYAGHAAPASPWPAYEPDVPKEFPDDPGGPDFYVYRGRRLLGLNRSGQYLYLFKPSGFFEYRFEGRKRTVVERAGTYRLEGRQLHLAFNETHTERSKTGEVVEMSIRRGVTERVNILLKDANSLKIGGVVFHFEEAPSVLRLQNSGDSTL